MDGFIFGNSPAMKKLQSKVAEIARTDIPVIILGETGVGKDALALYLHNASYRNNEPFEKLDCAQLNPTLFESELFGHEKGAFTGAVSAKQGRIDLAHGGTLFLDEIGNLELSAQAKLLNLLESRTYYRVGGTQKLNSDFRLICATNADLNQMVHKGTFRNDLYFRIAHYTIELPPLRHRQEDILPLMEYFLEHYQNNHNKRIHTSDAIRRCFLSYTWPGNVRQLQNMAMRLVALSQDGVLLPNDLPLELHSECILGVAANDRWSVKKLEKKYIELVLRSVNYNKQQAAQWLSLSLNGLKKKIARYQIRDNLPDTGCSDEDA